MVCSYRQIHLRKRYLVIRLSNCFLDGVSRKKRKNSIKKKKNTTKTPPTNPSVFPINVKKRNNFPLLLGTVLPQLPFAGSLFDNDVRQIIKKKQWHSQCETHIFTSDLLLFFFILYVKWGWI